MPSSGVPGWTIDFSETFHVHIADGDDQLVVTLWTQAPSPLTDGRSRVHDTTRTEAHARVRPTARLAHTLTQPRAAVCGCVLSGTRVRPQRKTVAALALCTRQNGPLAAACVSVAPYKRPTAATCVLLHVSAGCFQ